MPLECEIRLKGCEREPFTTCARCERVVCASCCAIAGGRLVCRACIAAVERLMKPRQAARAG